jgi:hypothetical protein
LLVFFFRKLDKRLVRTFLLALQAIITFRHSQYGLLLSELGGYILGPEQAPAGTKRLSNLLRSAKWSGRVIDNFLWRLSSERVSEAEARGETVYVGWDESVVEKPESIALEGLCAVRSSRAARLKRIKPGYFNPPAGRPVFVPGIHWLSLLVLVSGLPPMVAAMRWRTTRGEHATTRREEETALLHRCSRYWGRRVIHIWDRGFASRRWLGRVFRHNLRFILRWPKSYRLVNPAGCWVNAWKVTRGKRSLAHRQIWDARRRCWRKVGIIFAPVQVPKHDIPLWLVVSRPGQGREPWYLLTNEPISSVDDAWRIVFAYARRWQVEMAYPMAKLSWPWKVPASGAGTTASSSCSCSSMPSYYRFSPCRTLSAPLSSAPGVTEQESGTARPPYRFIVFVRRLADSGLLSHHPFVSYLIIRDDSCFQFYRYLQERV